jgi:hypothetical protein
MKETAVEMQEAEDFAEAPWLAGGNGDLHTDRNFHKRQAALNKE